jgi:hypothetical protein
MKPEQIEVQSGEFAQIWKDANHQRSEELTGWLKQLLESRRKADRPAPASFPPGRIPATG